MHSAVSPHGGDLKADTVTIIGHTLDLQEKVARDGARNTNRSLSSYFYLLLHAPA